MIKELVQYVRKHNKSPYATLYAFQDKNGDVFIGWSKYARSLEKERGGVPFSKKVGVQLAKDCTVKTIIFNPKGSRKNSGDTSFIPYAIEDKALKFIDRVTKYFKKEPSNVEYR